MILQHPQILPAKAYRPLEQYAELYNNLHRDDITRILRPAHMNLMKLLLRQYKNQIEKYYKKDNLAGSTLLTQVDTNDLPPLYTNNKWLVKSIGRHTKISEPTIYRHLRRLIDAGVITKTLHGSMKNFEIRFAPQLILIQDRFNKKTATTPDAQAFFISRVQSNCNPVQVPSTGNINKIVNVAELSKDNKFDSHETIQETDKGLAAANSFSHETPQETSTGNTTEYAKKSDPSRKNVAPGQKNDSENPYAGLIKAKIDQAQAKDRGQVNYQVKMAQYQMALSKLKLQFAAALVYHMVEKLLPDWNINSVYMNRVVDYVSEHYYDSANSFEKIQRWHLEYMKRIELAINYATNHPGYRCPAPLKYFDVYNQDNGFRFTKNMLLRAEKWKSSNQKRKSYKSDLQKLFQALKRFNENESQWQFNTELSYVRGNIPHFEKKFIKMAKYLHQDSPLNT